ncbi:hypothetical protein [Candidatus Neptunichlamydia sp. REUL1]|uniref:hypothetical protein n=1 Tax=Candidatus Neptunichlamydia sp. REUL1 TaxID=3064277 RepID=UPI00292D128B|nr:hypothetical protein [Candidatus Neptunochlamydia sp. REUL1]
MQNLTHLRPPQDFRPPSSPSASSISSISSDKSCGYSSASSSPENSPPARHLPLRLPEAKYQELFDSIDPWYPSPQQRISANTQHMKTLQTTINRKIQESYFFVLGKQQEDERFQKVFVDFFREIRGVNNLAKEASILLADHFRGYADVSEKVEYTIDAGDFSDIHCTYHQPTEEVILELKKILEEEYGLKGQLIKSLNKAGQKIGDVFQLDTHDTCLREFSIFPRLFPKCMKALKEIFSSLLVSEWLKKDIEEVKIYLKQSPSKESIERPRLTKEDLTRAIALWTAAKHYAEQQKIRDHQLSNKHRNELKDDLCSALISGGLSFITGDPSLVIGQAAKTAMNSFGNTIDPEGKDQAVQVLKLFGGFGLGSAMGRNSWDLGTALGVDLLDLATRAEKTGKGESALRNLGGSVLKGALTQDKKKLVCQVLGFSVAEAVNQLPETDETTPLDIRIARALISNGDVQSHYIKQYVDQKFKEAPKPKVDGELTPEEQEKYPKQEPTLADLQQQEDSKQHALKIQAAQNELIQKEAGVAEANKYLNEKFAKYQKACGAFNSATKELSKVIKGNENLSKAIEERDDAQKTLDSLQGIERIPVPESKPEKPKKPKTVVGKAWNWIKENVAVSGEISATKMPLYTTNPSTSSDRYVPRELSQAPPPPNRPQIREPNAGQWENVQAMQQGQLFNKNMQYQTPVVDNSPKAPLNYQAYWGQGLANNVQVPPMELRSLGRSNPVDIRPAHNRPLQMAGFSGSMEFALIDVTLQSRSAMDALKTVKSAAVNDFTKSIPKGGAKILRGICSLMLPDMSDVSGAECPKEHFKRFSASALLKYDKLVHIKDPHSFGARAGEFVGEMISFGGVGKVIRVAEGISVLGMACEGGVVGLVMAEAHDTNKAAGVAFGFGFGGAAGSIPKAFRALKSMSTVSPLQDRALSTVAFRHEVGRQLIENRILRCSFVSDKTVASLSKREITYIKPFDIPYVNKGPELEWWKVASPKIDRLKRVAKTPKKFYESLTREFSGDNLSELQIRRVLDYSGFKSFENPKLFPTEYVAEFADKNGGIIFRKPGTSNPQNLLIRICPGLRKENPVTAIIEGKQMNGTMRQQTHYVVQCKNNKFLTTDEVWVDEAAANTHIPLENYQFKGWE